MFDEPRPQVAIVDCPGYETDLVSQKVKESLELIGGLKQFVKPGMNVLLKPNFLSAKDPERAITTHPEIAAAVAREVRKIGAEVKIGDSPGGAKRGVKRVWQNTGFLEMAERESIELISFEASGVKKFETNGRTYYLAKPAIEADFIINLPKLKTHVLTLMTGAVKNMFGLIPGFRKANYHKQYPKPKDFSQVIVDILSLCPPGLTIMDAILSMEGEGPSSGQPVWTNMIISSADPVAVDAIASEIIGLKPDRVPVTKAAADAGLGISWPEAIKIVGKSLESARISNFKLTSNRTMELIPKFLVKIIDPLIWVRPDIDKAFCTNCNTCVTSCPVGAMSSENGLPPLIDYDICINCWCCHELCPEKSVYIRKSWLAQKFIR